MVSEATIRSASRPIYLDYNATTPIDPQVLRAMLPYLQEHFGNPSSNHPYGLNAKEAAWKAREQVANLIGAKPDEIVFTSGGSESDNHAIISASLANRRKKKGRHIITSRVEHPAVLETCRYLEKTFSFKVTYLPVDKYCLVSPKDVENAITDETILITIMHSNNEVGTVEPIEQIGEIARRKGVLFHTDAAQSCGKIKVDVDMLKVDMLTMAGHKLYAPKGIGALYLRKGTSIDSFIHGAGQENGRRAGTENVPYIIGLGEACSIAEKTLSKFTADIRGLRDRLHSNILEGLGAKRVKLNGHPKKRLPNTLNISISGVVGEDLLSQIPEIAASTGSACHSGSLEPSKVLLEMGVNREDALGTLRLTLGRWSTKEEVDEASRLILEQVTNPNVQSR